MKPCTAVIQYEMGLRDFVRIPMRARGERCARHVTKRTVYTYRHKSWNFRSLDTLKYSVSAFKRFYTRKTLLAFTEH